MFALSIPIHPPHTPRSLFHKVFKLVRKSLVPPWVCGSGHINNQVLFEFSLRIGNDVLNNGRCPFLESQLVLYLILSPKIVLFCVWTFLLSQLRRGIGQSLLEGSPKWQKSTFLKYSKIYYGFVRKYDEKYMFSEFCFMF